MGERFGCQSGQPIIIVVCVSARVIQQRNVAGGGAALVQKELFVGGCQWLPTAPYVPAGQVSVTLTRLEDSRPPTVNCGGSERCNTHMLEQVGGKHV